MAVKHSVVATGTNDAGKQVSVNAWNGDHTIDTDGLVIPAGSSLPPAPESGGVRLFARRQAGRVMPAFIGPSGLDSTLQPHLARNGFVLWKPTFTGTTVSSLGGPALTAVGTATSAPWAATSLHTRVQRVDYLVTTAATSAIAGMRVASATWRGVDGYHFIGRVAPATGTAIATDRFFFGMIGSTVAPTDVDPSTQTSVVGVGYDAADTNWQVFHNDASGVATKIDTGIAAPATDRQSIWTVMIFSPPGGGSLWVRLVDESTGASYETAEITTDIPAGTQAMAPRGYHSVGGTSSVVGFTFASLWIETDN